MPSWFNSLHDFDEPLQKENIPHPNHKKGQFGKMVKPLINAVKTVYVGRMQTRYRKISIFIQVARV